MIESIGLMDVFTLFWVHDAFPDLDASMRARFELDPKARGPTLLRELFHVVATDHAIEGRDLLDRQIREWLAEAPEQRWFADGLHWAQLGVTMSTEGGHLPCSLPDLYAALSSDPPRPRRLRSSLAYALLSVSQADGARIWRAVAPYHGGSIDAFLAEWGPMVAHLLPPDRPPHDR